MGLDLRMLPFEGSESVPYSHSILSLCRRGGLFQDIMGIERACGRDVPKDFSTFISQEGGTDSHYGATISTPYGDHLKEVQVKFLMPLISHFGVTDNPVNSAVWAYLERLPGDTSIALFWH